MPLTNEQKEQIYLFDYLSRYKPKIFKYAFYIPNEGRRSKHLGYLLKKMGLKPGVSDIFIAMDRGGYHGMFIELKAKNANGKYNKPTALQLEFHNNMKENHYYCVVALGALNAISYIDYYMNL